MAIWATKCDCCGERFCFLAVFKYPELEGTSSRARNWCFTLNNPSAEELYNLHTILPQAREFRFIVFQLEQGLDGATPHVQGYIEFNCQLRLNAAKRLISQRAHLGGEEGSQQQAIAYCEKQETRLEGPWRYGEPQEGRQGQRSDLLALKSALDEGSTDLQLWEEFFPTMMRYYKGWLSTRFSRGIRGGGSLKSTY